MAGSIWKCGDGMQILANGFLLQVAWGSIWVTAGLGQWRTNLEIGSNRFWGGSVELSGEHRSFLPYRPTFFGIGIERYGQPLGAGLQFHYSQASLGLEGRDAVVAVKGIFKTFSIAPEVYYRLASVAANQLRLLGGPLLEVWSIADEDTRLRAGVRLGLSLDIPLGARFGGSILGGAALIPSPFNERELTSTYERTALWRRELALRINYRL
jgi:hypothetical protein